MDERGESRRREWRLIYPMTIEPVIRSEPALGGVVYVPKPALQS